MPTEPAAKEHATLAQVRTFLLHRPEEIGVRVFNAKKSRDMLRARLTYRRDVTSVLQDGTRTEATHGIETFHAAMSPEWFAINLADCDLAELDITDGVISRICLFYKDPRVAARKMPAAGWKAIRDGDAVQLEASPPPNLNDPIARAIANKKIVKGMTEAQAEQVFYAKHPPGIDRAILKDESEEADGTRVVRWRKYIRSEYGPGAMAASATVTLQNGKVIAVEETQGSIVE